MYGYVGNDPINGIDPLGLIQWADPYTRNVGEKIAKTKVGRALLNAATASEKKEDPIRIYHDESKETQFYQLQGEIVLE